MEHPPHPSRWTGLAVSTVALTATLAICAVVMAALLHVAARSSETTVVDPVRATAGAPTATPIHPPNLLADAAALGAAGEAPATPDPPATIPCICPTTTTHASTTELVTSTTAAATSTPPPPSPLPTPPPTPPSPPKRLESLSWL